MKRELTIQLLCKEARHFAETESAGEIEEAIAAAETPTGAFIIEIEDSSYPWMKNILLNPVVLLILALITISRLCIFLYGKKIVINRTNSKINWDNYFDNKG